MKCLIFFSCVAVIGFGGCSVIRCTPDSEDAACTNQDIDSGPQNPELIAGQECAPHTSWNNSCGTCSCSGDGYAECRADCSTKIIDQELTCAPGSAWRRGCHICQCSIAGQPLCTPSSCDTSLNSDSADRKDVTDTVRNVSVNKTSEVVCIADKMFKKDCNTCWCNEDGTSYFCTRKTCVPGLVEETNEDEILEVKTSSINENSKVICVANRMFFKDCNTCWCNDDGTAYSCTRKVCVPELPELPEELNTEDEKPEDLRILLKDCRPDEVFEIDCNMCRCNKDGKSFSCTRRVCFNQEDEKNSTLLRRVRAPPQEAPKACQPGQEFRLDCNKCLCDNEGQDFSCTRIDCIALNNNNNGGGRTKRDANESLTELAAECTAGAVFQRGCDACRCAAGGRRAHCTTACQDLETRTTESDAGFRCNPGEQFKKECNDCTCTADGKSYFCTLRFCDVYLGNSN